MATKTLKILFIGLIISLITAGIVIFIEKKIPAGEKTPTFVQTTTAPTTTVSTTTKSATSTVESQIDTSDWEIYHNENWGFALKYPTDWKAETTIRNFNKPEDIVKEIISFKDPDGLPILIVYIWTNDSRSSLMDWFNKHDKIAYKDIGIHLPSSANTKVAVFPAVEIKIPQSPQATGIVITWFLAKEEQLVLKSVCNLYDRPATISSICKFILSTFEVK